MNKLLHLKSANFKKEVDVEEDGSIKSISIEGFASTSDVDRAGDVIPGSVWEKGMVEFNKNPIVLAFHDHKQPVGRVTEHKISDEGLWVKARISAASEKIFNLVQDGIISAFSVGFMIKDAEFKPELDLFIIKELELHELSIVSVGMNSNTLFDLSKAFKDAQEFNDFKLQFVNEDESAKGLEIEETNSNTNKEWDMDPKQLEELLAKAAQSAASTLLAEQAKQKAAQEAEQAKLAAETADIEARIKAAVEAATKSVTPAADIKVGESGAEKLLADIEAKIKAQADETKTVVESLQAELKEKADELAALQKTKMTFNEGGADVSMTEKEMAVILSKITNKAVDQTKFGKRLVEKVGPHVASATWELEVSTNMENEVRRRLVIAPTLRNVAMQTNVMTLPVNPEAGVATWVTNAQFGTTASTGPALTHQLSEITLNAYKVATLEYVNFEEEEDALIPLLPIIRDAMVRRVARAIDIAYLRGAGAGSDPVKGLELYDAAATVTPNPTGAATIANMTALRKDLGAWGLDPAEIVYIVSTDVYYDLMNDSNFQTVDKIGDRATLLTGQIGTIGNSPVLVSAEFEAKADTKTGAICFAPGNFVAGNQRGLRIDTDDLVETQRKVLVASMRTGLAQLTTNIGAGISKMVWTTP